MSKRLAISAVSAAMAMGLFAAATSAGMFDNPGESPIAGHAPLFDIAARR